MTADPDGTPATLEPLAPTDIGAAVALHARLLPHGFFVELGPRVLARYYRAYVDGPTAYAVAARVDGTLVGALIGTLDHEAHARWVTRCLPGLGAAAGGALLRRPHLIPGFLRRRALRYARALSRRLRLARRPAGARGEGGADRVAVLSHVYVDRGSQGRGLGLALVNGFVAAARASGAPRVELVTLDGGEGAGEFYERHGWWRQGTPHERDGMTFQTYVREL